MKAGGASFLETGASVCKFPVHLGTPAFGMNSISLLQKKRKQFVHATTAGGLLLLGASLLQLGCANQGSSKPTGKKGEGAVPVVVARVTQRDVPLDIQVIGNVEAYSTVTIKAQVPGQLTHVYFREGDYVKKGDLLFTIDPRPYQAQLSQAEANLARDRAQLQQAEANLQKDLAQEQYAQAQAGRYEKLFQAGVISKENTEQYRSSANAMSSGVQADKAAIESARAGIAATQAAIDTAKVQLSYTSIRSPIDGRTGILNVKEGNIVTALATDLMTINEVQPIFVTFGVPESTLGSVKEHMARGNLPVIATPQDDPSLQETGILTFVDNSVDTTTGTIKLRGTFVNPERKLWPGQFVRVTLRLAIQPHALVVPNQAVQTGQNGEYVYVVTSDQKADMRPVVSGSRVDQDVVIEKGLQPGEMVVTEGHLRLAPGMRVQVRTPGGSPRKGRPPASKGG